MQLLVARLHQLREQDGSEVALLQKLHQTKDLGVGLLLIYDQQVVNEDEDRNFELLRDTVGEKAVEIEEQVLL